jgi:thioredoxin reductase (NADPH)
MFFSQHAKSVTLLVRGGDLAKSMSHYLIEQLKTRENIHVLLNSQVVEVLGDGDKLSAIRIKHEQGESTVPSAGLFVFIGAQADTQWLPPDISTTDGYVVTHQRWDKAAHGRDPYLYETSVPGIFACGDVRWSQAKRVAAAVGEGSMAATFALHFLHSLNASE